jgi:hypothetical protein
MGNTVHDVSIEEGGSEMTFRRVAKVDSNHAQVVAAFRSLGCSVLDIHQLKNCADLIVAKNKKTVIVEVKNGALPKGSRKLTPGEREFFSGWRGEATVVESLDDVVRVVKELES